MKKIIICHFLTISLTVLTLFCFGQNKKNLRQYYYWINQAELAICDSNYYKASDCYEKAFCYHKPFLNHVECAYEINHDYIKNLDRATHCFSYFAECDDPIEWYIEDTIAEKDFYKTLKSVKQSAKINIDSGLQQAMETILEDDQKYRRQYNSFDTLQLMNIDAMDSLNWKRLHQLYKKYPLINDYTLGMSSSSPSIVIRHNCHAHGYTAKELWYKEVKKGNVEASRYMSIQDYCISYISKKKTTLYGINMLYSFQINNTFFILEPKNIKKIDHNRHKLGISETWADYCKKITYIAKNQSNALHFYPISHIYIENEAEQEYIKKIEEGIEKGLYFTVKSPIYE